MLNELQQQQAAQAFALDMADIVGIEFALARRDVELAIARAERTLARLPARSLPTSDMLLRLVALKHARSELLTGQDLEQARTELKSLVERILAGEAGYSRIDEARQFSSAP